MINIPVISVVAACSNSGKTTFIESLIKKLNLKNLKVATVKYSCCTSNFDVEGSDSCKFFNAGAQISALMGPEGYAIQERREEGVVLEEILDKIKDVDIIIVEGVKGSIYPTIEVIRYWKEEIIEEYSSNIILRVSDSITPNCKIPVYKWSEIEKIVEFIIKNVINEN